MGAALFYLVSLLHGVFASGFIPILRAHIVAFVPLAFALYFVGLVVGQLGIYFFASLRRPRRAFPIYELAFGAALLGMGLGFSWLPGSLLLGRLAEGLAAGLGVPLLFQWIAALRAPATTERRIALFNTLFAGGFVVGPPLVALALERFDAAAILVTFGGLFVVVALLLVPLLGPVPDEAKPGEALHGWFEPFYLLFLAKCAYGFILPYSTQVLADRLPFSVATILNFLAVLFVVGQWLGSVLSKRLPSGRLETVLPLALFPFILAMAIPALAWALFPGALVHSLLLFVALLHLGRVPGSAREFALLSSLSDPGLVVGAGLAAGRQWGLLGLAALCLVPVVRSLMRVRLTP